jgi:hypothetical protein
MVLLGTVGQHAGHGWKLEEPLIFHGKYYWLHRSSTKLNKQLGYSNIFSVKSKSFRFLF